MTQVLSIDGNLFAMPSAYGEEKGTEIHRFREKMAKVATAKDMIMLIGHKRLRTQSVAEHTVMNASCDFLQRWFDEDLVQCQPKKQPEKQPDPENHLGRFLAAVATPGQNLPN